MQKNDDRVQVFARNTIMQFVAITVGDFRFCCELRTNRSVVSNGSLVFGLVVSNGSVFGFFFFFQTGRGANRSVVSNGRFKRSFRTDRSLVFSLLSDGESVKTSFLLFDERFFSVFVGGLNLIPAATRLLELRKILTCCSKELAFMY